MSFSGSVCSLSDSYFLCRHISFCFVPSIHYSYDYMSLKNYKIVTHMADSFLDWLFNLTMFISVINFILGEVNGGSICFD